MADSNEGTNARQGARLFDDAQRSTADRMDNATIPYGQTVAANEPEVAAGSDERASDARERRAEGAGQPTFVPARSVAKSSDDLEALRGMREQDGRRPEEMLGSDPATSPTSVDRGMAARRGGE